MSILFQQLLCIGLLLCSFELIVNDREITILAMKLSFLNSLQFLYVMIYFMKELIGVLSAKPPYVLPCPLLFLDRVIYEVFDIIMNFRCEEATSINYILVSSKVYTLFSIILISNYQLPTPPHNLLAPSLFSHRPNTTRRAATWRNF